MLLFFLYYLTFWQITILTTCFLNYFMVYFSAVIKMTKIYIIRHCEAMGNVLRVFQGSSNFDVSELGKVQLKFLEERFDAIPLDRIYSSPLKRAMKTAEAVRGIKNIEIEPHDGLLELHGGVVEGKPFVEAFNSIEGLADAWDNHPEDFAPEGGEPMRHAYERIWETVKQIAEENRGKAVALSTHGGVTRCLMCRLLKNDIKELKNVPWSENTAVSLIEFDDNGDVNVVFFNDHSHLPEEFVNRKSRIPSFMKGNNK